MAYHENIGEWHGKDLVDRNGERIGKLEDVYVDGSARISVYLTGSSGGVVTIAA